MEQSDSANEVSSMQDCIQMVPRYNGPLEQDMTEEQKEIRESIRSSRPRTELSGPFGPWLAVPAIASPAQALGKACRYGTSLSFRESELVILLTAAKARSHTEFELHTGEAITAGISTDVINAIHWNDSDNFTVQKVQESVVPLLQTDREVAIVLFTAELLQTYTVSEKTYRHTKEVMDGMDSVLVEITSICGYYTFVAYTLNVFCIQPK